MTQSRNATVDSYNKYHCIFRQIPKGNKINFLQHKNTQDSMIYDHLATAIDITRLQKFRLHKNHLNTRQAATPLFPIKKNIHLSHTQKESSSFQGCETLLEPRYYFTGTNNVCCTQPFNEQPSRLFHLFSDDSCYDLLIKHLVDYQTAKWIREVLLNFPFITTAQAASIVFYSG